MKKIIMTAVADGTEVVFSTTAGTPVSQTTTTTINGRASFKLVGPTLVGTATVSAAAEGFSSTETTITFVPGPASSVALSTTSDSLTADGTNTTTVQAAVKDANGNLVGSELVNFSAANGRLSVTSSSSGTEGATTGIATVTYTAPSAVPGGGTDTVTATLISGTTGTVDIALTPPPAASVSVGSDISSIVADGSAQATVTATVKDAGGDHVVDGTSVTFTTTGGTLSSVSATTTSGKATAILTSVQLLGTATITATSGGVSDNTTVTFGF